MEFSPIRGIAIDDEPLAVDIIDNFCRRNGSITLTTFTDPEEGLRAIKTQKPDIVFLDIEMENISGLDIAAQLPPDTCFIFTTAYLNYALDGFNLDAVDYLHKPFSFDRFQTAVSRAMRRIEGNRHRGLTESIIVKQEYNNVSIQLNTILYIEAMEGYSKIYKENDNTIITRMVLKNMASVLPGDNFLRVHRSFIVAVNKIKSFTKQEINLTNGVTLPVGRQYSDEIMNFLMKK
ncbi:MAG: LytTR family DNA-binding domain-containing protein [Bacteroidales bacterium]|nr:LytTR family DNA-binding domain-containing protein [Bacteroidales bacterium]